MALAPDPMSYTSLVSGTQANRKKKPAVKTAVPQATGYANYPKLTLKAPAAPGSPAGLGMSPADQEIMAYLSQYAPKAPPTLNDNQLLSSSRADINSLIDPVLNRIRSANTTATQQGIAGIQGRSAAVQANLAPLAGQVNDYYTKAGDELKNEDEGLRAFLTSRGNDLGAGVKTALDAAGQASQPTADTVVGLGQGAAGEAGARGYADLAQTVGDRVSQTGYFEKLPGIAALQGQADEGAFRTTQANDLSDQLGQITSQVPGLVRSSLSDARAARSTDVANYNAQRQGYATLASSFIGGAHDRLVSVREGAKNRAQTAGQAALDRAAKKQGDDADRDAQIRIAANALGLSYDQLNAQVNSDKAQTGLGYATLTNNANISANDNATSAGNAALAAGTAASQLAESARQFNVGNAQVKQKTKLAAADVARTGTANLAASLLKGQLTYSNTPVAASAAAQQAGKGKYVATGGSPIFGPFTNDLSQAEVKLTRGATAGVGPEQAFKQAYALYGHQLKAMGYKDAEIKTIIREGITAAGKA